MLKDVRHSLPVQDQLFIFISVNWPLAGYVMRSFVDLLNRLSQMVCELIANNSEITIDPPRLPDFESGKCTSEESVVIIKHPSY